MSKGTYQDDLNATQGSKRILGGDVEACGAGADAVWMSLGTVACVTQG
jgi:hypothetical protein